jgi:hypothetical protein
MNAQSSHTKLPYGLLELNNLGRVIRYAPAFDMNPTVKADDILGHSLFRDVMPVPEIIDCEARFRLFMEQDQTTDNFTTTFPSDQGPVKVQILLARILENTESGVKRMALVRIMPED